MHPVRSRFSSNLVAFCCVLFFGLHLPDAMAQRSFAPRQPYDANSIAAPDYNQRFPRIVLKFHDGSGVRSNASGQFFVDPALQNVALLTRHHLSPSQVHLDVMHANAALRLGQLLTKAMIQDGEEQLARMQERAETYWHHEVAELGTYLQLPLPKGGEAMNVRSLVATFNDFPSVEIAYAEPMAIPAITDEIVAPPPPPAGSCPASSLDPGVADFTAWQGYLQPAPAGVDIAAAHSVPGGQGSGVRIIDIEGGYYPHADLPKLLMTVGHQSNSLWRNHGTKVLGILAARDNGLGTLGLAPSASVGQRSIYNSNLFADIGDALYDSANVANHIYWGAKHSIQGVVLLEVQRFGPVPTDCACGNSSCQYAPVEYWPAEFDVIQTAVGNGAVIVQAAGNGSHSLDDAVYADSFNRLVRDSGSLLVSGSETDGVTPSCTGFGQAPNYGSRIDLHAWADGVATTTQNGGDIYSASCSSYISDFNGSSSASAIIAGVAAAVQGIHRHYTGTPMAPADLIDLLSTTGTPQVVGPVPGVVIGPQPDLANAVTTLLNEIDP